MLRRSSTLRISEFSFGHPKLSQHFGSIKFSHSAGKNKDAGIQSSTLPNGLRVVTHDKGQPVAGLGFYCEVGAKFDPIATAPGLNYAFRQGVFGGNMENSLFQTDRAMRGRGASYESVEIRKQYLGWKSEVRRDMVEPVVNTLGLGLVAPRFAESDIERFRDTWDNNLEEMKYKRMHDYAAMQLENTAFWKEPLGNSRMVQPEFNGACSGKLMLEHWAQHVVPSRMVLAGVNVNHEALVSAYLSIAYPHSADAPHHARSQQPALDMSKDEKAQFRAGAERHDIEDLAANTCHPDQKEDSCVAIGWLSSGRNDLKEFAAASIVHEIMGSNLKDSLDLQNLGYLDGARTFYSPFASAGLIGYTLKAESSLIASAAASIAQLPASITEADIEGAKTRALTRMFANELDVQRDYVDFLATSPFGVNDFNVALKSATVVDVKRELDQMKAQAPVAYGVGHIVDLPNLKTIQSSQKA